MNPPPCVLLANGVAGARVLEHALGAGWPIERLILNRVERQREADRLRATADSHGLAISVWSQETKDALVTFAASTDDVWLLSIYFAHLLPAELLGAFGGRGANVHPSLLPWGRGAHSNVWTLIEGTPAGVSLHLMTERIDAGPLLAQRSVPVYLWDTAADLHKRLEMACADLVSENWPEIAGLLPGVPQGDGGSYHAASDFADVGQVILDDRADAERFFRQLRALSFPPHRGLSIRLGSDVVEARVTLTRVADDAPGEDA